MAITATNRGTGTDSSSSTTTTITFPQAMTAGNTGILCLAMDNAGGATPNLSATSYNDSKSNVWYVRQDVTSGSANAGVEVAILYSYLTASVTTSDTLAITFTTASGVETWSFIEASTNVANAVVYSYFQGNVQAASTNTATPSVTSTAFSVLNELVIGVGGSQSPDTWVAAADTTNGAWINSQHTGTGSGAAGISIITQTKIATAYGAHIFNPTQTAAICRLGTIPFTETDNKIRAFLSSAVNENPSTVTISTPFSLAAGSLGVLCIAADNAGTGGAIGNLPQTTFTDSKSNTWTMRQNAVIDPGVANQGAEVGIYTSPITTPLVAADTITLNYVVAVVPSKCVALYEFAPVAGGTMSYVTGGVGSAAGAATSYSMTTGSIANGDYVIAMTGAEFDVNFTGDTDTTNGVWRAQATRGTGASGGTVMSITAQAKKVTATATQSYDVTSANSGDMIGAWIQVNESSATINKGAFFQMFR